MRANTAPRPRTGHLVLSICLALGGVAGARAELDASERWRSASRGAGDTVQDALAKHARLARERGSSCLAVVRRRQVAEDWNCGHSADHAA